MEISFDQYERIQDYLEGIMTPEMREDFQNELNADSALAEHLIFERDLRKNLESIEKDRLVASGSHTPDATNKFDDPSYILALINNTGRDFHKTGDQNSRRSTTISMSYKAGLAIAASLIIVLSCAITFFSPSSHPDGIAHNINTNGGKIKSPDSIRIQLPPNEADFAALFRQFFTKEKTPAEKPVYLAAALNDYDRGKYNSIQNQNLVDIPIYRGSYTNSQENVLEMGHFYKGLAFMESGRSKESIRNLQWVIDHAKSQQLITKARWYLALVHVKDKDRKSAVSLLISIAENTQSTLHKDDAKKLLDLLRK